MHRDPEHIRAILFEMEAMKGNYVEARLVSSGVLKQETDTVIGNANQKRAEHMRWMVDDGLIALVPGASSYYRITSKGCDFLDAVRDEGIWVKTKKAVAETGGSATLDLFKQLALGFLKKKISDKTGINL